MYDSESATIYSDPETGKGVSLEDLARGTMYNKVDKNGRLNLALFAQYAPINSWAKYKFEANTTRDRLTDEMRKANNYGLSFKTYKTLTALEQALNEAEDGKAGEFFMWDYKRPRGVGLQADGTMANEPFRILDMDGYCRKAVQPKFEIGAPRYMLSTGQYGDPILSLNENKFRPSYTMGSEIDIDDISDENVAELPLSNWQVVLLFYWYEQNQDEQLNYLYVCNSTVATSFSNIETINFQNQHVNENTKFRVIACACNITDSSYKGNLYYKDDIPSVFKSGTSTYYIPLVFGSESMDTAIRIMSFSADDRWQITNVTGKVVNDGKTATLKEFSFKNKTEIDNPQLRVTVIIENPLAAPGVNAFLTQYTLKDITVKSIVQDGTGSNYIYTFEDAVLTTDGAQSGKAIVTIYAFTNTGMGWQPVSLDNDLGETTI